MCGYIRRADGVEWRPGQLMNEAATIVLHTTCSTNKQIYIDILVIKTYIEITSLHMSTQNAYTQLILSGKCIYSRA